MKKRKRSVCMTCRLRLLPDRATGKKIPCPDRKIVGNKGCSYLITAGKGYKAKKEWE